jgi:hypothetical protein
MRDVVAAKPLLMLMLMLLIRIMIFPERDAPSQDQE